MGRGLLWGTGRGLLWFWCGHGARGKVCCGARGEVYCGARGEVYCGLLWGTGLNCVWSTGRGLPRGTGRGFVVVQGTATVLGQTQVKSGAKCSFKKTAFLCTRFWQQTNRQTNRKTSSSRKTPAFASRGLMIGHVKLAGRSSYRVGQRGYI